MAALLVADTRFDQEVVSVEYCQLPLNVSSVYEETAMPAKVLLILEPLAEALILKLSMPQDSSFAY